HNKVDFDADLHRALDNQELTLHYQPIVDLADEGITGFEALVRWQHPSHGLVAPLEFIPLAEETGLIVPIGAWVLDQACEQIAEWNSTRSGAPLTISVNLSG